MKLIKWKDIRWDIVKDTAKSNPWWLLGWPVTVHKITSRDLFKIGKSDRPHLEIRIPFTSKVTWTWEGKFLSRKDMHPVISHSVIRFQWNKFLWFWRES